MGGYNGAPIMIAGGGGKPNRGGKNRGYSQYNAATTAAYYGPGGGWGDHRMGGGFYGPAGYGIHVPMMRGHLPIDPSSMEYMTEQFQGEPCPLLHLRIYILI